MESNYTLSDIAAVTDGGMGGMGGNWFAWILLFALFGGNGFGFGGRGQAATTDELSAGFNFSGVNNKLNELTAGQANINQNLGNAICTSTYELAGKISGVESALQSCCCGIERNIDGVNYNVASQAAAINANTTAQTQKILDAICGNRMADMQNQINQLQLQSALCGVVRYPTSMAYTAGYSPFCGYTNGCGCANI